MKSQKVWRYYCDFCKKSGCRKDAMVKHELHCTMNPNRICRMCGEDEHIDLERLIALLPEPNDLMERDAFGGICYLASNTFLLDEAIKKIRELTDCPACIMAALRQKGIPVPMASTFDYKKEVDNHFQIINEEEERDI